MWIISCGLEQTFWFKCNIMNLKRLCGIQFGHSMWSYSINTYNCPLSTENLSDLGWLVAFRRYSAVLQKCPCAILIGIYYLQVTEKLGAFLRLKLKCWVPRVSWLGTFGLLVNFLRQQPDRYKNNINCMTHSKTMHSINRPVLPLSQQTLYLENKCYLYMNLGEKNMSILRQAQWCTRFLVVVLNRSWQNSNFTLSLLENQW